MNFRSKASRYHLNEGKNKRNHEKLKCILIIALGEKTTNITLIKRRYYYDNPLPSLNQFVQVNKRIHNFLHNSNGQKIKVKPECERINYLIQPRAFDIFLQLSQNFLLGEIIQEMLNSKAQKSTYEYTMLNDLMENPFGHVTELYSPLTNDEYSLH